MEEIIQFDKQLLLMLNGSDSYYLDQVVLILTNGLTWIPLYVSLLFLVVKNNHNWRTILLIVAGAGLCVLMAGTLDDEIVKPLVGRWRPTHDPQITRLYLGVHYPGDILVGLLWGTVTAISVYSLFRFVNGRWVGNHRYTSQGFTSSGYEYRTTFVPLLVLILTVVYALLRPLLG